MAIHNLVGTAGEKAAIAYLIQNGYTIVETNWRHRRYELDIIAQSLDELIIVEVKTRSLGFLESPTEAVTHAKIRRIIAATESYILRSDIDLSIRFDIISVVKTAQGYDVEHIPNAFYSPIW